MKETMKKWWFWASIILIAVTLSLIVVLFNKNNTEGVGSGGISKEEFEEIETGMSQSKVESIIDKEGKWDDDDVYTKCCEEISKTKENHVYKYQYKYYGERSGYAIITYEADYSKGDIFVLPTVVEKKKIDLK